MPLFRHRAFATLALAIPLVLGSPPLLAQPTQPATQTAPAAAVSEGRVYTIPPGVKVVDTVVSPDNQHLGIVEQKEGRYAVVVDGIRGPEHDWVVRGSLSFSATKGRFCYQIQEGDKLQMVVGTAGPQWDAAPHAETFYLIGRSLFSPDGARLAYVAQKQANGPMTVVLDGTSQPPADEVFPADLLFSADGKRFAYCVRSSSPPAANAAAASAGGKQQYVVDGVAQPPADSVGRLTFSPDGSRWGYTARDDGQAWMVIDGKAGTHFPLAAGLTFSPDGKQYSYAIETPAQDGKAGSKQALVYNNGSGEKQFRAFDGIGAIVFSPDSKRLATTMQQDGKWSVFVDGKSVGSYDGTGGLLFSPDSSRLAFVAARGGQQFLVADGHEYPPMDAIATGSFSPDSKKVAILGVQKGQRALLLEDRRVGPASPFAFSPQGSRLAHFVSSSPGHFRLALDGEATGPEFELSPPGSRIVWDSPTKAHAIVGRGSEMLKVTLDVGPRSTQGG